MLRKYMKVFVNLITSSRFIYTLFLPYIQTQVSSKAFLVNLIVLYLTDTIDGFLARTFHVQTFFGSVMDTIADKALTIMLLIILVMHVPILTSLLYMEIIISLLNMIEMARKRKTKTIPIGKVKTWVVASSVVFGFLYSFNIINYFVLQLITLITLIMQVETFVSYYKYLQEVKTDLREKPKIKSKKDIAYILFDTEYYLSSI